ncbi:MAG: acyltransferase [Gammaproteobacteria bacterium]|nr:acyltransferase [Gammaproteobacteria bacterium]MDH5241883.1 acyltransferase [Gammaproteobacteria bacterium]MDH5262988.1 acyltransferase [Gammaproteobacteria bacterium]MDH5584930.1 acyltransferase [Gammaproteobacteria bacterium]
MKIWAMASQMAAQTPQERNRYVDFLRSVSILVVIVGHWLIATAWVVDGEIDVGHLLADRPQLHWVTWLFQVMPIFFIVGGYSNAVSLESANRKGVGYGGWLSARLNRLVAPLLVLLVAWAAIAISMSIAGARPVVIQYVSQAALIPTWFLSIYIVVVMLAPLAYRFWQRFGFASFVIFAAGAALTDLAFFAGEQRWLGWTNYLWVWLAVHHLGFAWRDDRLGRVTKRLLFSALGFIALWLLTSYGPYPLAMVGSPDPELSNTLPPKITLLALGIFQFGLLLALEEPMRRALGNLKLWTATVLINSMIMTVYLWHITVMVILAGLLYLAGGAGLGIEPGTMDWWLTRPVWIAVLLALLLPVALLLSPLERRGRPADAPIPAPARQVAGALMICLGVALLAMYGYGGGPLPRLDAISFALVIVGSGISGLLPKFR